ncbi:jumonji domain-containing protein 6, partial [Lobosporangium transversale]
DRRRPPYRWFVMGGPRSGTGIHIDPLGTSAWNTLTTGHKRWCLFPPGIPKAIYDPPMKPFDREAVSWFHHVYPRFAANDFELGKKYGMIQVIQRPGETMFVPGGWPHIVMNLDFTIAITQNFCSPANFEGVWLYTRHARPKLARKFRSEIERLYNKTGRCYYKNLLDKCRSLAYVPMLPMSTDDSSSSSSSSSDSSDDSDVSSTESESDVGEICMCHKCKKRRRKEARRASKDNDKKTEKVTEL